MFFAIDIRNGNEVSARSAYRGKPYKCPVCKQNVYLKAGSKYKPYFAHEHHSAKPECHLYFPSFTQHPHAPQVQTVVPKSLRLESLKLGVYVDRKAHPAIDKPRKWHLCVLVPKSEDGRGSVSFNFSHLVRNIPLEAVRKEAKAYFADPNVAEFKAISFGPGVDRFYRSVCEKGLPGLSHKRVNLFSAGTGKLFLKTKHVEWGSSYFLVWHGELTIELPELLEFTSLDSNAQWMCSFVTLPARPDEVVKKWFEQFAGAVVPRAQNLMNLIYPFLSIHTFDGKIKATVVPEVLVELVSEGSSGQAASNIHVSSLGGGEKLDGLISTGTARIISEELLGHIQVEGELNSSIELMPPRNLLSSSMTTVSLRFTKRNTQHVELQLNDPRIYGWLDEVRLGEADLIQLVLPNVLQGELRYREDEAGDVRICRINPVGSVANLSVQERTLSSEELAEIHEILRNRSYQVTLWFPGFCNYLSPAIQAEKSKFVLKRNVRRRMLWLQREAALRFQIGTPASSKISDEDLLSRFNSVTPPLPLRSQFQAIATLVEYATMKNSGGNN